MTNPYGALLRLRPARKFCLSAFVARMPMSMLGIATVLLVQRRTGSYALAGATTATIALSQSAAGTLLGRAVDRLGQRRVLLPALAAHVTGVVALLLAAELRAPVATLFPAAALVGAAVPPISASVRVRWSWLLRDDPRLTSAFALESVLDELVFVLGPVLVTTLAVLTSPAVALGSTLLFSVGGVLTFAALRGSEPPTVARPRAGADRVRAAIRVPGLRVVVCAYLGLGAAFGSMEVVMVAFARSRHAPGAAGPLLALTAVASAVSGLLYGAHTWKAPLSRRFRRVLGVLGLGLVPLLLAPGLLAMVPAALIAGIAISPTLITGYGLVERLVEPAARTEGFTWLTASLEVGLATGAAVAGRVIDGAGARAAFAVSVVAGLLAGVVAAAGSRRLVPRPDARPAAVPDGGVLELAEVPAPV